MKDSTATLFTESTSEQARQVSSQVVGRRYVQIVEVLSGGPACIFEVAQQMGCFDHQISGRFGEMERLGLIRKTGQRRVKPSTGCHAEVYEVVGAADGDVSGDGEYPGAGDPGVRDPGAGGCVVGGS